ncbi:MAG TPA: TlpA disulfide reductase family protein [Longimicrobiales bacterium]|nr:TlpA disulfide reductase family protein [Longimicrobiales bacterium]
MRRGVLLGLLVVAAGCADSDGYRPLSVGDVAPAYAAVTPAGDTLSLEGLRGEPVLLNVWATWCPPCREEMPGLEALHREFAAAGLRVVGVSIDRASARPAVEQFVEDHEITFTILLDPEDRVTRAFRLAGVPETYLIDAEGRIVRRWIGRFDPLADETLDVVRQTLRQGSTVLSGEAG